MSRTDVRPVNLSALLLDHRLARGGDRPALREADREWSLADLASRTGSVAAWLRDHGVRAGDTVGVAMGDRLEWLALVLGAARIGAVCALASPVLPRARLAEALGRADPRLVVADEPIEAGGAAWIAAAEVADAGQAGLPDPGPVASRGDDPCYLLLTSGSTGPSKWAVHRHRDIGFCLATYGQRILRLRPGDVTWSVAVLATSYGFGNSGYFPVGAGACAWIEGADRSPAAVANACAEGGVNVVFGVPTWWARVARHAAEGRIAPDALSEVRLAVSAGEHLPAGVWEQVRETLGLRLVNGLGSSEATNLYLSDRPGNPRPGTVGWPVAGFELRIAPSDPARPDVGELLVRGGSVTSGYLGDPQATRRLLDDGWLRTGDLVRREPDASHTYLGRMGEPVKVGALWATPSRVQEELLADPDVAHAVVLGAEDPEGLTRLVAVVTARAGAPPDLTERLRERCAEHLAAHEVPRLVLVVEELPTLASGKIDRAGIARAAAEALSAPPAAAEALR